jgi:hypothetical protein
MSKYFSNFPKIQYDIAGTQYSNYQTITNIFFRVRFLREVLANASAYYLHQVKDGDTPEILAEKAYGDSEAYWMILLANEIVDPMFDWPMDSRTFQNYIVGKYGSIENAKITTHHYEKVVRRENGNVTSETRFIINQDKLTTTELTVPYDYYEGLAETQSVSTYNLEDNSTVIETIYREAISNYDYEEAQNDKRRAIKIPKKQYYGQIMKELDSLTDYSKTPYLRRI